MNFTPKSYDRKVDTIWTILSNHNKTVGILKPPVSYPVEKVNGFIIAGYPIPNDNFRESGVIYPEELTNEISNWEMQTYPRERYHIERMTDESLYLMGKYDWDFFMIYFQEMDWIGDNYWPQKPGEPLYDIDWDKVYGTLFEDQWKKADMLLGKIIKNISDNTIVFVVSSHSMESEIKPQYAFFINKWLMDNGFLKLNSNTNDNWRQSVDWSQTKAYADMDHYEGRINLYINLKGREPNGIVESKYYTKIRDEILELLYNTTEPESGVKIFDKSDLWEKAIYLGNGPDIVFRDYRVINRSNKVVTIKTYPSLDSPYIFQNACKGVSLTCQRGNHVDIITNKSLNGIIIVSGPNIKKAEQIHNANVMDIFPTILHIFNVTTPNYVDGRVLHEIFK
jgi:predicted AlkP superfamily phosphohydrolase/phosphomutase